ncbi:unnamed protein product [Scytosiphon promiscuus]
MYTEATCCGDELPGCAGGCIPASDVDSMLENGLFNFDLYCPMYDCDGTTDLALSYCLSDDPVETLNEHSGVAPGAKISMFDYSYTGSDGYVILAGNLVWESAMGAGAKLHSNSWGYTTLCQASELDLLFDVFMHKVRGCQEARLWRTPASHTRHTKKYHLCKSVHVLWPSETYSRPNRAFRFSLPLPKTCQHPPNIVTPPRRPCEIARRTLRISSSSPRGTMAASETSPDVTPPARLDLLVSGRTFSLSELPLLAPREEPTRVQTGV